MLSYIRTRLSWKPTTDRPLAKMMLSSRDGIVKNFDEAI